VVARTVLVEVTIDSVAAGGDGVGRLPDGRVVFVPLTAPGDRVRVRIEEDRKRYARGSIDTLIDEGTTRCLPRCPVFGTCGGCAWQHIRYEDQLEAKRRILADALTRLGGLELPELPPIQPSPQPYHYRSRTRVLIRGGLVGYRRRRTHRICAISSCPVLAPPVDALLSQVADAPENWSAGEAGELASMRAREALGGTGDEEEWELSAGSQGAGRSWRVRDAASDAPEMLRRGGADSESEENLAKVTIRLAAYSLQISPGVFMQANALMWQSLVDAVVAAAAGPGRRLVELYSGAGFFTLALSRCFSQLVAVESDSRAVADLRVNLATAEAANVRVAHASVEDTLAELQHDVDWKDADCVVLDPPRSGMARGAVERLAALNAQRIVYLSCDPATLARDLRLLCEAIPAYRLTQVGAFDLFPQTPHVEGLVVLEQL